jgi:thiol-disulfide isomerase/thioredoxin
MNSTSALRVLACGSLLLAPGCGYSATSESPAQPASGNSAAAAPASDDVKLSILSFDEIQKLIAGKRGKVVVVDAWSTSCPPCLKDFHNLVELANQYRPDDVACISLSFDYEGIGKPQDVQDRVLGFLRSQRATFDNVMSSEESDVLYRKFKLNAVPAIFVYERSGKLRQRFENEGAYAHVRPLVAELVQENPPPDEARKDE